MTMDSLNKHMLIGDELMELVREQLKMGQKVRYLPFRGVSMRPMLRQGRDAVELAPLPQKLEKYDLPVYRRSNGQYVMHRVVGVKESYYICLGDNTVEFEKIYPEQMVAIVSAFVRDGKRIEVEARGYQIYCRLWRLTRPFRKLWKSTKSSLRRLWNLLKNKQKQE